MTILIAGGGIGGLCTAIALHQRGMKSHIFEQAETFSEVGAGIQIGPNGMRLLEHWGLGELLENKGATPSGVRIRDGYSGQMLNEVPLGKIAEQRYGAPYKVFHRAELQMALLQKARSLSNITITTGYKVKNFSDHQNEIVLRSAFGTEIEGSVLVGADGLWSNIRSLLHPDLKPVFTGKIAWRTVIPRREAPPPSNLMQTGLWMAPDAHLVHYPVMGGEFVNVVAVIAENFSEQGWHGTGRNEQLLTHYEKWHDMPRQFLGEIGDWQKWALFDLKKIPTWSLGRVTLLGDAAHPPTPFLAQGGVMAMEDAFVLAQKLEQYGDDHQTAFTEYEGQRRSRTIRVMDTAKKMGKIYHMKGLMRHARNAVLKRKAPEKLLADYDWLYGFVLDTSS